MAKSLSQQKTEAEIAVAKAQEAKEKRQADLFRLQAEVIRRDIAAEDAEVVNQRIYDFVGSVTELSVGNCIDQLSEWRFKSGDPITVRFNSPGGDIVAGFALYDYLLALRSEGIVVGTIALGWAASMAGILLQAGTTRYVGASAFLLIHEVSSTNRGKISEQEDETKFVKRLQARALAILAERSVLTARQIERRQKRRDWWIDAQEAVDYGFADSIIQAPRLPKRKR